MTSAPEPTPDQRAYTVRRAPRLTAVLAVALALGLLIALKNRIDQHLAERASAAQPVAPAASRRVRVTGVIE